MNNSPKISKLTELEKGFDINIFKHMLKEHREGKITETGILVCIDMNHLKADIKPITIRR